MSRVPIVGTGAGSRHLAAPIYLYRIVLGTFACPLNLRHLSAWSAENGTIVALPMDTASRISEYLDSAAPSRCRKNAPSVFLL